MNKPVIPVSGVLLESINYSMETLKFVQFCYVVPSKFIKPSYIQKIKVKPHFNSFTFVSDVLIQLQIYPANIINVIFTNLNKDYRFDFPYPEQLHLSTKMHTPLEQPFLEQKVFLCTCERKTKVYDVQTRHGMYS